MRAMKLNPIDVINDINSDRELLNMAFDSLAKNEFFTKKTNAGNYWIINNSFEGYVSPDGEVLRETSCELSFAETWETTFEILSFDLHVRSAYINLNYFINSHPQGARMLIKEALASGCLSKFEKKCFEYISKHMFMVVPRFLKDKKYPVGRLLYEDDDESGYKTQLGHYLSQINIEEYFCGEPTEFKKVYKSF